MGKLKLTLALILIMSLPQAGFASFISGNTLFDDCESELNFSDGFCKGYIAGVVDVAADKDTMGNYVCLPEGVTLGQIVDVVHLYLQKHPEQRHYTAFSTAMVALRQSFPCN